MPSDRDRTAVNPGRGDHMGGNVARADSLRARGPADRRSRTVRPARPRRMVLLTAIGWLGLGGGGSTLAQEASGRPPPPREATVRGLSLAEALLLARSNNPLYLQAADAGRVRRLGRQGGVRPAPPPRSRLLARSPTRDTASSSSGTSRATTWVPGARITSSRTTPSGVSQSYGASTYYGLSRSRAERSAAGAWLGAEGYELESRVTARYLAALRAEETRLVAERQLAQAEENLELAEARFGAGAVPGTDLRQAEVERRTRRCRSRPCRECRQGRGGPPAR